MGKKFRIQTPKFNGINGVRLTNITRIFYSYLSENQISLKKKISKKKNKKIEERKHGKEDNKKRNI